MKVIEVIKKYNLEEYNVEYYNQYGNFVSSLHKKNFMDLTVKSISINFPTNQCKLTIIEEDN